MHNILPGKKAKTRSRRPGPRHNTIKNSTRTDQSLWQRQVHITCAQQFEAQSADAENNQHVRWKKHNILIIIVHGYRIWIPNVPIPLFANVHFYQHTKSYAHTILSTKQSTGSCKFMCSHAKTPPSGSNHKQGQSCPFKNTQ